MEIQAYNKNYLPYVAETLGIMFEFVVKNAEDAVMFWDRFISSNVAKQIEVGNPKYLNYSALDCLSEIYGEGRKFGEVKDIDRNQFYWAGWIVAQFQQKKGCSFYKINELIPIETVLNLYPTLHEADVTKFFDFAESCFRQKRITNLKKIRLVGELSQKELANRAGVEVRTIQAYEQRTSNINKASAEILLKLARVLGCKIEDLLEF